MPCSAPMELCMFHLMCCNKYVSVDVVSDDNMTKHYHLWVIGGIRYHVTTWVLKILSPNCLNIHRLSLDSWKCDFSNQENSQKDDSDSISERFSGSRCLALGCDSWRFIVALLLYHTVMLTINVLNFNVLCDTRKSMERCVYKHRVEFLPHRICRHCILCITSQED
jgi:hypothetical protein